MLPTVQAKAPTIEATAVVGVMDTLVTNSDVQTALAAIAEHAAARSVFNKAEKSRETALCTLFQKLLGVKTLDELKLMDPLQVTKRMQERHAKGEFTLEKKIVGFVIDQTREEKRPAWKEAYVETLGQAKANEVIAATPTKYSYTIKPAK